ncbi:MAG: adenylate/guanylate cyclase domain-containing protein [Phormidesmis sp.]
MAAVSVWLLLIGTWNILEQQSYNLLHRVRQEFLDTPVWDDRVVVIAIDEASVESLGRFPWSRSLYADLLNTLQIAQPAVVAFDILFPESTDQDLALAKAIATNANVVLAVGTDHQGNALNVTPTLSRPAAGFFLTGHAGNYPDTDGVSRRIRIHGQEATPSLGAAALQMYAETMASTTQAIAPNHSSAMHSARQHQSKVHSPSAYLAFDQAGNQAGNQLEAHETIAIAPDVLDSDVLDSDALDSDAIAKPMISTSRHQWSKPAVSAAPVESMKESMETALQRFFRYFTPSDSDLWINWPGGVTAARQELNPGDLQIYSYVDVIEGRVAPGVFQNKIVLVGATLAGLDPLRTPFHVDPPVSGVYLSAATVNNLLNHSFLQQPSTGQVIFLVIALSLVSSCCLRQQGFYQRLAAVVCFPLLWGVVAYVGFLQGWWLPVAAPISTVVLSALALQLQEQRERQQLMDLFSMNVSAGTAELIWRHKGVILHEGELAPQTLTATVLFMDIRGFSSIAETLPSQQLLPWLNQYFETMTDCIMAHGGMVDKYIGDAIMAVFGAPVPRTQLAEVRADAIAAVSAGIEMHERLRSLNRHLITQNLPTIEFGIGIHTGALIGGTVGNRHRLNYSLFGDTVNIAARLEALTKTLPEGAPFKLLLSADTCNYAQSNFPVRRFHATKLRGREGHTEMYTLTEAADQPPVDVAVADEAALPPLIARLA